MTPISVRSRYVRQQSCANKILQLRSACDWQDILYIDTVHPSVYDALSAGLTLEVKIDGVPHLFEVFEAPKSLVMRSDGWYIKILSPAIDWQSQKVQQYGVTIQCQGHAWSGGVFLESALEDLEALLGLACGPGGRIPGRCDLCADVWIQDGVIPASEIYSLMVADGSVDIARQHWSTQAKRRQVDVDVDPSPRVVKKGGSVSPTTLYIGSSAGGLQLVIYEKTADFVGNTRDRLIEQWKKAGWDGSGLVARFEWRVSREWIRRQDWPTGSGKTIKLAEFRNHLTTLWSECLKRIRWAPPSSIHGSRVLARHRPITPLWAALAGSPPLDGASPGSLVYSQRRFDSVRLMERAIHTLINIREAFGPEGDQDAVKRSRSPTHANTHYRENSPWKGHRERCGDPDDDDSRREVDQLYKEIKFNAKRTRKTYAERAEDELTRAGLEGDGGDTSFDFGANITGPEFICNIFTGEVITESEEEARSKARIEEQNEARQFSAWFGGSGESG